MKKFTEYCLCGTNKDQKVSPFLDQFYNKKP